MEEKKKKETIIDISDLPAGSCKATQLGWEGLEGVVICKDDKGSLSVHPVGQKKKGTVKIQMDDDEECEDCKIF